MLKYQLLAATFHRNPVKWAGILARAMLRGLPKKQWVALPACVRHWVVGIRGAS